MTNYKLPKELTKKKVQKTKVVAFRVDEELAETIDKICKANNMSKTKILETAMDLLLEKL